MTDNEMEIKQVEESFFSSKNFFKLLDTDAVKKSAEILLEREKASRQPVVLQQQANNHVANNHVASRINSTNLPIVNNSTLLIVGGVVVGGITLVLLLKGRK